MTEIIHTISPVPSNGIHTDRQTDRQTIEKADGKNTHTHTDRQTDKQTNGQAGRQAHILSLVSTRRKNVDPMASIETVNDQLHALLVQPRPALDGHHLYIYMYVYMCVCVRACVR